ncbi:MAG TPA: hypothetical protein ENH44_00960 [Actinobacteria bacterium]|nr:hypothetical protein [Actinomycetota bacterium]
MGGELKLVRKFASDYDADFAMSELRSAGIPAIVLKDDAGGMFPQFQMIEGVRLMVREQDLKRAREVIEDS